ncbi:NAD(P)H-dependent glycerol-3-phosphate dehydrogenase [Butyrivibrio sp. MC2013]|uniref:NAD(P)H-dependent glycerol-3-phosphate dehydrogenase n=1 Tax=Butyrivibrio sp. MC2013 TaxID=1280686 RepID=UPI000405926A|nr:NAD(P)H-dependent glycerol-3-phosphate dehydrogenase [Butyrivibrio sp. MC2013]
MEETLSIGILGAGSWGMALAFVLGSKGYNVTVWSRRDEMVRELTRSHENKDKLPGVILPDTVGYTSDIETAVKDKDIILMVVPAAKTRETCKKIAPFVSIDQVIVTCSKGIEESTMLLVSEVIEDELDGRIQRGNVAVLSGPSHAEEVGRMMPTAIVVGASTASLARRLQNIFMSKVFRVYISPDMTGIELGGACKNVIALAAGIADGLGYGDNTKAALITRGITEITRLGMAAGGQAESFSGLTGIGDLIVTCASMHSRNRRAGILIGQGKTPDEAMDEVHMVVEGVFSAKAALELARKYKVETPIIEQVCEVLFNGKSAREAVADLMLRDGKVENNTLSWPDE